MALLFQAGESMVIHCTVRGVFSPRHSSILAFIYSTAAAISIVTLSLLESLPLLMYLLG